jgi:1,4-dihydroxy-2-naphthoate octaprenyltransferase
VRLGRARTRVLYVVMLAGAYVSALVPWLAGDLSAWLALCWLSLPLAVRAAGIVRSRTDGPALNGALAATGALQLAFCVLLGAGIVASP